RHGTLPARPAPAARRHGAATADLASRSAAAAACAAARRPGTAHAARAARRSAGAAPATGYLVHAPVARESAPSARSTARTRGDPAATTGERLWGGTCVPGGAAGGGR